MPASDETEGTVTIGGSAQEPASGSLADSAKASILWGGGFTIFRDFLQFGTMLVLVRLLSPEDYGSAALAQSIVGVISVLSFGTFVMHALQLRDPRQIEWQIHFTAGAVINSVLFCATLAVSWALHFSERYNVASVPLAVLSTVFIVEIPGTLRHRMLETEHDWKRFRQLLIVGSLLAASAGLIVALLGGGVWALIVQPPLLGVPAAIDLFFRGRWRPTWSWSWARYRDTAQFGFNRMGSGAVFRGRQAVEQTVLAGAYDFAILGVFTRSVGLATLIAGRIGAVAMASLYPIVTRAEHGSQRFRRIASLVLRGVCWTTLPAAAFLTLSASDAVALLYGPKWQAVVPLLPLAVAAVAISGIASTVSSLLLAGNEVKTSLLIDLMSSLVAIGLAFWLVPLGIRIYLGALVGHGLLILLLALNALASSGGIDRRAIIIAFAPALAAVAGGALAVEGIRLWVADSALALRLSTEAVLFTAAYVVIIRIVFSAPLQELLEVSPGGRRLQQFLFY